MKVLTRTIVGVVGLLLLAGVARADWPNNDPTKWVQLPDRLPTGLDVDATAPKILADDFLCTFSGFITDVHIWGSWLNDVLPPGGPGDVTFKLSFHLDIPAGVVGPYSRPGAEVWTYIAGPGSYLVRPDGSGVEHFFDPEAGVIIGNDNVIWQYNFLIPEGLRFFQQQGSIYWLDVQALVPDPLARFGWKTSLDHWNDDATWALTPFGVPVLDPMAWGELRYPVGHPLEFQSIDLAFALTTPEPGTILSAGGLAMLLLRRRRDR